MNIVFVPLARDEFLDAISHYEEIREGLGQRFKNEVNRSVLRLAEHYELYRVRPGGYRRINLRVFPYYIPFLVKDGSIWILAVAHSSRKPVYWIDEETKNR